MPQIICPLLTSRQMYFWLWEISFHFHKTVSSSSPGWYLRLGVMGEAEALRSLWIRLHNQSRQKKNPGRRIPTFAIYLFPPVLGWSSFFSPSNGTTWLTEYNLHARSYTEDKIPSFYLEEDFKGSEPMNQTWTDRRPFALSYTHTETLTTVGLKHKHYCIYLEPIPANPDLSSGDILMLWRSNHQETLVIKIAKDSKHIIRKV